MPSIGTLVASVRMNENFPDKQKVFGEYKKENFGYTPGKL